MEAPINQARVIFYDFLAGCFLRHLLQEREELFLKQLEVLKNTPLDEAVGKSAEILFDEISKHGVERLLDEHDGLFAIPMKGPLVLPYVSHYEEGCFNGAVLVEIRQAIKELPVRLNTKTFHETEDHLGFLFFLMRYCIEKKHFSHNEQVIFSTFLAPVLKQFIKDLRTNPRANFYVEIATILESFAEFEVHYLQ